MKSFAFTLLAVGVLGLCGCELRYPVPTPAGSQGPCSRLPSGGGTCVPECGRAQCGDDGCGGSCGYCPSNAYCSNGSCIRGTGDGISCDPLSQDCSDRAQACYPDGARGVCTPTGRGVTGSRCTFANDCAMGFTCTSDGLCGALCDTYDSRDCAAGETCYALGGSRSVGVCDATVTVTATSCVPDCSVGCGSDGCGGWCGACPDACVPNCSAGCGDDGCGGRCGDCPDACVPDCSWGCGADGCGGWCGDC